MKTHKRRRRDFDSPWKEALEHFLPHFMGFFYPHIQADIDWSKGYESLDKELHQLVRDARLPKGLADKLFKVWLKDGSEEWLLIHIEIQGEVRETFSLRTFVYNVRSFLRYNKPVVSLAVLTDEQPDWRPDHFEYGRWTGRTRIDFLPVKLLDHRGQEAALERDPNPFAQVVLAHLQALALRKDVTALQRYKVQLVKGLYDRGWTAEEVRQLFLLIDWLMDLPPELQQDFHGAIVKWEEERRMAYVSSLERSGWERGRLEAIQEDIATCLKVRFGTPGKRLAGKIPNVAGPDELRTLFEAILRAETLAEVKELLPG